VPGAVVLTSSTWPSLTEPMPRAQGVMQCGPINIP